MTCEGCDDVGKQIEHEPYALVSGQQYKTNTIALFIRLERYGNTSKHADHLTKQR